MVPLAIDQRLMAINLHAKYAFIGHKLLIYNALLIAM